MSGLKSAHLELDLSGGDDQPAIELGYNQSAGVQDAAPEVDAHGPVEPVDSASEPEVYDITAHSLSVAALEAAEGAEQISTSVPNPAAALSCAPASSDDGSYRLSVPNPAAALSCAPASSDGGSYRLSVPSGVRQEEVPGEPVRPPRVVAPAIIEEEAPAVKRAPRTRGKVIPIASDDDSDALPAQSKQESSYEDQVESAHGGTHTVTHPALGKVEVTSTFIRRPGQPPVFSGVLQLDGLDLKAFQKALKKYKKCTNMKKLSALEYFVMRYTEIAYFEVSEESGGLAGVLGYGNQQLVGSIKDVLLSEESFPSVFGVLAELDTYCGPVMNLRQEDLQGLLDVGFTATESICTVPVTYKKAVTGLWIATANDTVEIPEKELAALKKQFTNFVF